VHGNQESSIERLPALTSRSSVREDFDRNDSCATFVERFERWRKNNMDRGAYLVENLGCARRSGKDTLASLSRSARYGPLALSLAVLHEFGASGSSSRRSVHDHRRDDRHGIRVLAAWSVLWCLSERVR
jgi:hypothetical protein